jgi:hypothetical protein
MRRGAKGSVSRACTQFIQIDGPVNSAQRLDRLWKWRCIASQLMQRDWAAFEFNDWFNPTQGKCFFKLQYNSIPPLRCW